jgi:hypothetical protein
MGPIPFARTIAQMKNAMPAVGTKNAFTVNKCRILWTGGYMNGRENSQNRKKDTKWTVDVPEFGMPFAMPPVASAYGCQFVIVLNNGRVLTSRQEFHIARIIKYTQLPPIQACTPYHMQAIAARLKTGHKAPQTPKEARLTTGNDMWYVAPIRPVRQTKHAAMEYPSYTRVSETRFKADISDAIPRHRSMTATMIDRQRCLMRKSSMC